MSTHVQYQSSNDHAQLRLTDVLPMTWGDLYPAHRKATTHSTELIDACLLAVCTSRVLCITADEELTELECVPQSEWCTRYGRPAAGVLAARGCIRESALEQWRPHPSPSTGIPDHIARWVIGSGRAGLL